MMKFFTVEDAVTVEAFSKSLETLSGAKTFLVGGCVRDGILGLPIKDVDLEVFGIPFWDLVELLGRNFGRKNVHVHGEFVIACVTLDSGFELEFAVPRLETKVGESRRSFAIQEAPHLPVERALMRRDFTVNALMVDACKISEFFVRGNSTNWLINQVIDECQPFLGDLLGDQVVLRPVSEAFSEDPLRVLRAMRFISKIPNCVASTELIDVSRGMVDTFKDLSLERIHGEFKNMFLTGRHFVAAFDFLRASGWLVNFHRLNTMATCPQDPVWHPEGDVLRHTAHCLEHMISRRTSNFDEEEFLQVMWAILIHDAWKPDTFEIGVDKRIHNPQHDAKAGQHGFAFLMDCFGVPRKTAKGGAKLAELHMAHVGMTKDTNFRKAAKRLAVKIEGLITPDQLFDVVVCDMGGRPPLKISQHSNSMRIMNQLTVELFKLNDDSGNQGVVVVPLISGADIMAAGIEAGPLVGKIKGAALNAQVEEEFDESTAGAWLITHIDGLV